MILPDKFYVNGKWTEALSGRRRAQLNPGDESVVGEVAYGDAADCRVAIEAAHAAFAGWSRATAYQRGGLLAATAQRLRERREELAQRTSLESGKPLAEAVGEWSVAADLFEYFAEEGKRAYGRVVPARAADRRISVLKQPLGVVGVITAWNFPAYNPARACAAALAAGCTVVCRPSELTPWSALGLAEALDASGVPAGVFNVVHGEPESMGAEMLAHPACRKISFTGSVEVGRALMIGASATLTRLGLELGGNAPIILFEDAAWEMAVDAAVAAKFRNAGQVCVAPQRFLVHDSLWERFLTRTSAHVAGLRVGPASDAASQVGPLISAAQRDRVEALVEDVRRRGARVHCGGRRPPQLAKGFFYEPTFVSAVPVDAPLWTEETFGPVLAANSFRDDREALRLANDTPAGLAAYVWTANLARAVRAYEELEFGMVAVNSCLPHATEAPFVGWKQSGLGAESGPEGLHDYLETKVVSLGGLGL